MKMYEGCSTRNYYKISMIAWNNPSQHLIFITFFNLVCQAIVRLNGVEYSEKILFVGPFVKKPNREGQMMQNLIDRFPELQAMS